MLQTALVCTTRRQCNKSWRVTGVESLGEWYGSVKCVKIPLYSFEEAIQRIRVSSTEVSLFGLGITQGAQLEQGCPKAVRHAGHEQSGLLEYRMYGVLHVRIVKKKKKKKTP